MAGEITVKELPDGKKIFSRPLMLGEEIFMYAKMFGVNKIYPWQFTAIFDFLTGKNTGILVCNAGGKTSVVYALAGLIVMCKWPGARVISTSGSYMQISTQLWPHLRVLTSGLKDWKWTEKRLVGPEFEFEGLKVQSEWNPFSTDEPGRAEGHHFKTYPQSNGKELLLPVAYMIDEAKTVDQGIFDASERCKVNFRMVASSSGEDFGPLYDRIDGKLRSLWKSQRITWEQCPHLYDDPAMRKMIESEIKAKGRTDPVIGSQYFSEWIRSKGYYVFKPDLIKLAMSGQIPKKGKERRCAIDYSQGTDEQHVGVREGNMVIDFNEYHEKNVISFATRCIATFTKFSLKPEEITVDAGGAGREFMAILEYRGWGGIRKYNNNDKPRDKTLYANIITEDCFEGLANCMDEIILPQDEKLERQMRERKYVMSNDDGNRMRLEAKENIRSSGRESPDRLDEIIMLFRDRRSTKVIDNDWKGFGRDGGRTLMPDEFEQGSTWNNMFGMRCDQ